MTAQLPSPWLTIVTVVKDDLEGLRRTSESLGSQDLTGTEWIVVDSSEARVAAGDLVTGGMLVETRVLWTDPRGVYPAMNEALRLARGRYIHFLNAGDAYAGEGVVEALRDVVMELLPLWMYGQVVFVAESGREVMPPSFSYAKERALAFSRGRFPPHQGTVVRTDALRDVGGFDESFRIVADYAAFLRLSLIAEPVEVPDAVARFYEGGVSSARWRESIREFHRARVEILQPAGWLARREEFETLGQFLRMGTSRMSGALGRPWRARP